MASSVATPLEQQFAAIPGLAEMTSTSGVGNTTITLQFDLDRNIDAAAQDVQQAINAATGLLPKDLPNPPTYRKTNPADRPVLIYAVHSDAMPVYRLDDYAYTILAQKLATRQAASRKRASSARSPMPCTSRSIPAALAARGIGLEDVRTAIATATRQPAEGQPDRRAPDRHARHQRPALRRRRVPQRHRRLAQRRAGPARRHRRGRSTACRTQRTGAWFEGKPAEGLAIQREAGANTHRRSSTRSRRCLPQLPGVDPAVGPCRPGLRPLAGDPRRGARRAVHDDADDRAGGPGHLHLPAHAVGDRDPERGGAAVAARDLRASCTGSATASTTSR